MNIRIVTKETWNRLRGQGEMIFSSISGVDLPYLPLTWSYYVLDDVIPFLIERSLKKIAIPRSAGNIEEVLEAVMTSKLDMSEWIIKRTNEEADHVSYTKNEYKRLDKFYSFNNYSHCILPGTYQVESTKTGEEFEVSVWYADIGWTNDNYLCYPEKKRIPYDRIALIMKEKFLEIIFKENGKDYRKTVIKC